MKALHPVVCGISPSNRQHENNASADSKPTATRRTLKLTQQLGRDLATYKQTIREPSQMTPVLTHALARDFDVASRASRWLGQFWDTCSTFRPHTISAWSRSKRPRRSSARTSTALTSRHQDRPWETIEYPGHALSCGRDNLVVLKAGSTGCCGSKIRYARSFTRSVIRNHAAA